MQLLLFFTLHLLSKKSRDSLPINLYIMQAAKGWQQQVNNKNDLNEIDLNINNFLSNTNYSSLLYQL